MAGLSDGRSDGQGRPADTWTQGLALGFAVTLGLLTAADAYGEVLGCLTAFGAAWYVGRPERTRVG